MIYMSENTGYYNIVSDLLLDYLGIFYLDETDGKKIYEEVREQIHYFAESRFSKNEELAVKKFGELLAHKPFNDIIIKFKENDKQLFNLLARSSDGDKDRIKNIIVELLYSQLITIFLFLYDTYKHPGIQLVSGIDKEIADVVHAKIENINALMRLYSAYRTDPESISKTTTPGIALRPNRSHPQYEEIVKPFRAEITKNIPYGLMPKQYQSGIIEKKGGYVQDTYRTKYMKYKAKYMNLKSSYTR